MFDVSHEAQMQVMCALDGQSDANALCAVKARIDAVEGGSVECQADYDWNEQERHAVAAAMRVIVAMGI